MEAIEITVGNPPPIIPRDRISFFYQPSTNGQPGINPDQVPWVELVPYKIWISNRGRSIVVHTKRVALETSDIHTIVIHKITTSRNKLTMSRWYWGTGRDRIIWEARGVPIHQFILTDPGTITCTARRD